jgi:hypothetical protein
MALLGQGHHIGAEGLASLTDAHFVDASQPPE